MRKQYSFSYVLSFYPMYNIRQIEQHFTEMYFFFLNKLVQLESNSTMAIKFSKVPNIYNHPHIDLYYIICLSCPVVCVPITYKK